MALGFTKFVLPPAPFGEGQLTELCRGTVTTSAGNRVWLTGTVLATHTAPVYGGYPTLLTLSIDGVEPANSRNNIGFRASTGQHALPFSWLTAPLTAGAHEFIILGWYGTYASMNCHAFIAN